MTRQLIATAKAEILAWGEDEPQMLATQVARLCRSVLDSGSLPTWRNWTHLRESFDSSFDESNVNEAVCDWDWWCRHAEVNSQEDRTAAVKLGIVSFVVKFLAKQFGLLEGSDPILDFNEWKSRLCHCLDNYVGFMCREES